jgi:probable rRNA maturation factor
MAQLSLSIQYADSDHDWSTVLPRPLLRRWVNAALQQDANLTLRFVNEAEGQALNRDYRAKDYATNVLTFAYNDLDDTDGDDLPEEVRVALAEISGEQIEADIILCGAVLQREAEQQGKSIEAHAAHLIVHGVLHAQGFDHLDDDEAELMEDLEKQILARLGFEDPYVEGGRIAD